MKLTEIIKQLSEIVQKHGDLEGHVYSGADYEPIREIEVVRAWPGREEDKVLRVDIE